MISKEKATYVWIVKKKEFEKKILGTFLCCVFALFWVQKKYRYYPYSIHLVKKKSN